MLEILPVFSSRTGVTTASVGAREFAPTPPVTVTTGSALYPKPSVSRVIEATAKPRVDVAVAPDPVVSPVAALIVTVGALPEA